MIEITIFVFNVQMINETIFLIINTLLFSLTNNKII